MSSSSSSFDLIPFSVLQNFVFIMAHNAVLINVSNSSTEQKHKSTVLHLLTTNQQKEEVGNFTLRLIALCYT